MQRFYVFAAFIVAVGAPVRASAEPGRWFWESFTAAGYNPLGLIEVFTLGYHKPLYASDHPALEKNFVNASVVAAATPAYGFLGLQTEFQPATVLRLRARGEMIGFFGSFGHVSSFDAADADYSETAIQEQWDAGENAATYGSRLTFTALVQGAIKPVAVRSHFQATRVDLDLPESTPFYYSPQFDYLIEDQGWFLQNDADLVWLFDSGAVAGLRWNTSGSIYSTGDDPNGPAHRVGPLLAVPVFEGTGRLKSATVIGLVNWHIAHRWRTGIERPQWLPYMAAGFALQGDL